MTASANQTKQSLKGRTVVVIGSDALTQSYLTELKTHGARALVCPPVEITDLESHERLDEALEHLYGYDWLLFASRDGADYFLRRLQMGGYESDSLDDLRVCAIGENTERFLRDAHVHIDLAPLNPQKAHVFTALEQFVGGSSGLNGLNFLTPRATSGSDSLTRALTDAGARVDVVPSYQVRVGGRLEQGRTKALLLGQADCLLLTAPDSVTSLARLFDTPELSEVLGEVFVAATDAVSAEAASQYGLLVKPLPDNADEIAPAIAEYLSSK